MRVLVPFQQPKHKTGLQQMNLAVFKTASTSALLKRWSCIYRRRNQPEWSWWLQHWLGVYCQLLLLEVMRVSAITLQCFVSMMWWVRRMLFHVTHSRLWLIALIRPADIVKFCSVSNNHSEMAYGNVALVKSELLVSYLFFYCSLYSSKGVTYLLITLWMSLKGQLSCHSALTIRRFILHLSPLDQTVLYLQVNCWCFEITFALSAFICVNSVSLWTMTLSSSWLHP